MDLTTKCPGCKKEYKISKESWIGRSVTCKTCLTEFIIENPPVVAVEPIPELPVQPEEPITANDHALKPIDEQVTHQETDSINEIEVLIERLDALLAYRNEPVPLGAGFYMYFFFLALPAMVAAGPFAGVAFFLLVISILLWKNLYRQSPMQQFKEDRDAAIQRAKDLALREKIREEERIALAKFKSYFTRKKKDDTAATP